MANVYATKIGNWSDPTLWNTGSLPTTLDDVFANNFTVFINVNTSVLSIQTNSAPGINAGGNFRINNNISLSANVKAGTTTCLSFVSASPNVATIVGNISGSDTTSNAFGLDITNSGTVNVYGSIYGGLNRNANLSNLRGISQTGTNSILNIFGNIFGGQSQGGACYGLMIQAASANIVGNVYGSQYHGVGNNCGGINTTSTSTFLSITGNCYGGNNVVATFPCAIIMNGGTVNIVGNLYGPPVNSNSTGAAIHVFSSNPITIRGNVYGGDCPIGGGYTSAGIFHTGSSLLTVNGDAYGGKQGAGVVTNGPVLLNGVAYGSNNALGSFACGALVNSSTGSLTALKAVSNDGGLGSFNILNVPGIINSQNGVAIIRELQSGRRGQFPVTGNVFVQPLSSSVSILKTDTFQDISFILSNSATNLFPPVSSVRSGILYNQGNSTGTLVLPDPSAVALGVPSDNTTGTAILIPNLIWNTSSNTLTANSLSGTMGYRLNNAATVQTVGHLIAAYNT